MATETTIPRLCFLAMPAHFEQSAVAQTMRKAITDARFRIAKPVERSPTATISAATVEAIARADCIVADVTGSAHAVFFELVLHKHLTKLRWY